MGRQKGIKNSEASKQKMRENNWSKRGFSPSMLGRHHSEETKKKIALAHMGYKFSDEAKEKMRIAKIGTTHICSEEAKRKISEAHKKDGHKPPLYWKGKKLSIEHKEKLRKWHRGKILSEEHRKNISKGVEKHYWEKGKTCKLYALGWTNTFKEQIRYRDEYKCQLCGMPEIESNRKLDVHHIDYNKKNIEANNLITLCADCHRKTNYNREYWIEYFKEKELCENY